MEEMDLDSVEVRLEVEVELSSDSDCSDANEDVAEVEDDSGDELVSSGSEESDGCGEERFARGVLALSSNSCSDASDSSSGDDEGDMCDRKSAGVEVGSDVDGRLASAFTLWPCVPFLYIRGVLMCLCVVSRRVQACVLGRMTKYTKDWVPPLPYNMTMQCTLVMSRAR